MFTGLIEKVGRLKGLRRRGGNRVLTVAHDAWEAPLKEGESVAVQGVCLTVTELRAGEFCCNVLDETLARTNLTGAEVGAPLNLERALRVGDRLGGHILTGHVDGVATVTSLARGATDWILRVGESPGLAEGCVTKGSIACNGVSLTVSAVSHDAVEVRIIPYTWDHTSLGALKAGGPVNIELDIFGKYVRRYLAGQGHEPDSPGVDDLIRTGFA